MGSGSRVPPGGAGHDFQGTYGVSGCPGQDAVVSGAAPNLDGGLFTGTVRAGHDFPDQLVYLRYATTDQGDGVVPRHQAIYRFTTLARPLDPSWRTNRAVLVLMPLGAIISGVVAWWVAGVDEIATLWAAVSGAAVVLGAWALGRELAPDDERAAFFAMILGFGSFLMVSNASLFLLFTGLMLSRLVARTVGLPPTMLDGFAALAMAGATAVATCSPDIWLIAALALGLDAGLGGRPSDATQPDGVGRAPWQLGFVALAVAGTVVHAALLAAFPPPGPITGPWRYSLVSLAWAMPIAVAFLAVIVRTRGLRSVADATGEPLSPRRVRGGMVVVLVLTVRSVLQGDTGTADSVLLWATLAGVSLSGLLRRPDSLVHRTGPGEAVQ